MTLLLVQNSDGFIARKEEVASFADISSWENLAIPLNVSVKRETDYASGQVSYFVLGACPRTANN